MISKFLKALGISIAIVILLGFVSKANAFYFHPIDCIFDTIDCVPPPSPSPSPSPTPDPTPDNAPTGGGPAGPGGNGGLPSSCTVITAGPVRLGAIVRSGKDDVKLNWSASDNTTTYSIYYGVGKHNYTNSVPSTGQVNSYTVSALDLSKEYCFVVQAINSCQPGPMSNEECTALGGPVLGLSDTSSQMALRYQLALLGLGAVFIGSGLTLLRKNG